MANLQDFISETLVQITEGVKAAQTKIAVSGAMINPKEMAMDNSVPYWRGEKAGNYLVGQTIEFDIAVVASEEKNIKGGMGIVSVLGYEANKENASSSVSRIKFSVPIFLPQQDVELKPRDSGKGNQPTGRSPWDTS